MIYIFDLIIDEFLPSSEVENKQNNIGYTFIILIVALAHATLKEAVT